MTKTKLAFAFALAASVIVFGATGCRGKSTSSEPTASLAAKGGGAGGGKTKCPLPGQIAVAEICNGFDDDCDGQIDEGGICRDECDEAW